MEGFENIRQVSYTKYAGFNKNLSSFSSYHLEIPSSKSATFVLGHCQFSILPVLSTTKKGTLSEVTLFNESHPTGLNFPQITEICRDLQIPPTVNNENIDGVSDTFRLSYTLSALVCSKVNGFTFLSATPKEGDWIWFVVLTSTNAPGKKYLERSKMTQSGVKKDEAAQWYALMGI